MPGFMEFEREFCLVETSALPPNVAESRRIKKLLVGLADIKSI